MSRFEKVGHLTWESVQWITSKEARVLASEITKKYKNVKKTVKKSDDDIFYAADVSVLGYYIELKFRCPADEAVFIMKEANGE